MFKNQKSKRLFVGLLALLIALVMIASTVLYFLG